MKKIFLLAIFALLFSANAFAHEAFTLVSSEKKTVKKEDLPSLEKRQTAGKKDKTLLSFTEKEIHLVILTGPEDDMLSYRIQGMRNPNLAVPTGATLKVLFVNVDVDMRHDVRFGNNKMPFDKGIDISETVGSAPLPSSGEDAAEFSAEEMTIRAEETGEYNYYCSVRGHARGGMWGNILVGVKPNGNLKMAEKTEHVHSPDEDKEHSHGEEKKTDAKKPDSKMNDKKTEQKPAVKKPDGMSEMEDKKSVMPEMSHADHTEMKMSAATDLGAPMSREASGTAWVPDNTPMYARMKMYGDGSMLMLHGNMFFRYTTIGSSRDASVAGKGSRSRFDAPSMFMAMYSKPLTKKSQLGLRAMISLDPIIERGYGYPLLYQSGELYRGRQIHDRQHPHDFFSELSVSYSYKFDENNSFYFYAGYPGEPALGPPAYVHRLSAMNNPDAPIGHHWQDASHITWGVLTTGFNFGKFKIEASAFKGTEPDENRWNFDAPKLNSFSGRLSWNPTREWAFQVSHGYLRDPEPSEPDLKILRRTTASAIFNKIFTANRNWANSFVWGQNHAEGERTNSFLFESNYDFDKNAVFGRFERVEKNSHELVLPAPHPEGKFWVGAYSLGYLRDIYKDKGLDVGIGGMATFNTNPAIISSFYGGTKHGGWQVFLRLRPSKMK